MPFFVGPGSSPDGGLEMKSDRVGIPTATSDPASAILGDVYMHTVGAGATMKLYDGSNFIEVGPGSGGFSATGGTVSAGVEPGNGYRYHMFLEPGNFEVTTGGDIEVLVIAGGGGSGWDAAGGGGAGGLRTNTLPGNPLNITSTLTVTPGTIPIAVGDGGGRSTAPTSPVAGETGSNGGNSSIGSSPNPFFVFASGGGGGGGGEDDGNGGSGGGSGGGGGWRTWPGGTFPNPATTNPNNGTGPAVTSPDGKPGIQGNAGAYGVGRPSSSRGGGGGGGAGGAGTNAPGVGGAGGNGVAVPAFAYPFVSGLFPSPYQPVVGPIIGPTGLYAGGGQGGGDESGNITTRTPGGGGGAQLPGSPRPQASVDGINGTGSGGGGAGGGSGRGTGGDGGDGIVLIRYQV